MQPTIRSARFSPFRLTRAIRRYRARDLCFVLLLGMAIGLLAFLTGCSSPGRSLESSAVNQIRDGQTSRAEVDQLFGRPKQITQSPANRTLYIYRLYYGPDRSSASAFAAPRSDEASVLALSVLFNAQNIVEKHLYSQTHPSVSLAQRSLGVEFKASELASIRSGITTKTELLKQFGPEWSEELTLRGERLMVWLRGHGYTVAGRAQIYVLEVVLDNSDVVAAFRVTQPN